MTDFQRGFALGSMLVGGCLLVVFIALYVCRARKTKNFPYGGMLCDNLIVAQDMVAKRKIEKYQFVTAEDVEPL